MSSTTVEKAAAADVLTSFQREQLCGGTDGRSKAQHPLEIVKCNIVEHVLRAQTALLDRRQRTCESVLYGCEQTDKICAGMEAMLLHGLQAQCDLWARDVWKLLKLCMPQTVMQDLSGSQNQCLIGMIRAYVRDMLNTPGAPVSVHRILQGDGSARSVLQKLYSHRALLRDEALRFHLMTEIEVLQGELVFKLRVDHPCLRGQWSWQAEDLLRRKLDYGYNAGSMTRTPLLTAQPAQERQARQVASEKVKTEKKKKNRGKETAAQTREEDLQTPARDTICCQCRANKEKEGRLVEVSVQTSEEELESICEQEESNLDSDTDDDYEDIYARKPHRGEENWSDISLEDAVIPISSKEIGVQVNIMDFVQESDKIPVPMAPPFTSVQQINERAKVQEDFEDIYRNLLSSEWKDRFHLCDSVKGMRKMLDARQKALEAARQLPQKTDAKGISLVANNFKNLFKKTPLKHPLDEYTLQKCRESFLEKYALDYALSTELQPLVSYKCAVCEKRFDDGKFSICHMSGQRCCHYCHSNKRAIIPYNIMKNFDFQLYPVCDVAFDYLKSMETRPWIDDFCFQFSQETKYVRQTAHCTRLRGCVVSLCWLLGEDAKKLIVKEQQHLADITLDTTKAIRLFSVQELVLVNEQKLQKMLERTLKTMEKHVKNVCPQRLRVRTAAMTMMPLPSQ